MQHKLTELPACSDSSTACHHSWEASALCSSAAVVWEPMLPDHLHSYPLLLHCLGGARGYLVLPQPSFAWRRGEEALVTAGKRYAREQLNLDLTPCNHWLRFLEVHYQRPPPSSAAEALETSEVCANC